MGWDALRIQRWRGDDTAGRHKGAGAEADAARKRARSPLHKVESLGRGHLARLRLAETPAGSKRDALHATVGQRDSCIIAAPRRARLRSVLQVLGMED